MKKLNLISFTGIIFAMGMATTFGQAFAAVIYQSASPGPADCSAGGSSLDNTQFLGARLSRGSATILTGMGGHVCGPLAADDFFAAILPVTGSGTLPGFDPLDLVSNALVFGAGLLGTSGVGWMPEIKLYLPGASYFFAGVGRAAYLAYSTDSRKLKSYDQAWGLGQQAAVSTINPALLDRGQPDLESG